MREKGVTVIELAIVISVIGVLVAATAFSYQDWLGRYKVERTTCELYADLMRSRLLAVQTNQQHLVVLEGYSYRVLEDVNCSGKEDAGDRLLPSFPKQLDYLLVQNVSSNKLVFDTRGLVNLPQTLRVDSTAEPDCDCMKLSRSRIIMGRYDRISDKCITN